MGLDMYLEGHTYLWGKLSNDMTEEEKTESINEVFEPHKCKKPPMKGGIYRLGYWRKHSDLHGYIVKAFAKGVDECQQIYLSDKDLEKLREAVNNFQLPHTEGFFFGASDHTEEERQRDNAIIDHALEWLNTEEKDENGNRISKSIYYQASW